MTKPLKDKVIVITGAAGLLGRQWTKAVQRAGGEVVGVDLKWPTHVDGTYYGDVTDPGVAPNVLDIALETCGRVDGLINNAANNPKVEEGLRLKRFEDATLEQWNADLEVGLTGAFLFCKTFAPYFADNGGGAIVNVASVLSVIAPDQRLYEGSVKPPQYSVEKHGLVGLTRYVAGYYGDQNVRCNALSPAGVYNGQDEDFVERLCDRIPMARMARKSEYRKAMVWMLTQEYLTGQNIVVDGGYSIW